MSYFWTLFVITALEGGDYKYTHIATYDSQQTCEIDATIFIVTYQPFQDNETVMCVDVSE